MKFAVISMAKGINKRLPGKNMKLLGGQPLVQYTLDYINRHVDNDVRKIFATESDEIKDFVRPFGFEIYHDRFTSTHKLAHAIYADLIEYLHDYHTIWMLPTTPFRSQTLYDRCMTKFIDSGCQPVLTTQTLQNFLLRADGTGVNFDRSQPAQSTEDIEPIFLVDSGAFIRPKGIPYHGCIWFGFDKVHLIEEDPLFAVDIDTEAEFLAAERQLMMLHELGYEV